MPGNKLVVPSAHQVEVPESILRKKKTDDKARAIKLEKAAATKKVSIRFGQHRIDGWEEEETLGYCIQLGWRECRCVQSCAGVRRGASKGHREGKPRQHRQKGCHQSGLLSSSSCMILVEPQSGAAPLFGVARSDCGRQANSGGPSPPPAKLVNWRAGYSDTRCTDSGSDGNTFHSDLIWLAYSYAMLSKIYHLSGLTPMLA